MARIRALKPGFFTDADLCELPMGHRILFEGLWCHADRAGRLEDKPRELKVHILPYDDYDIDAALTDIHNAGFIQRYVAGVKCFIQILGFEDHQRPHKDEKDSIIPAPTEKPGNFPAKAVQTQHEHLLKTPDHGSLITVSGSLGIDPGSLNLAGNASHLPAMAPIEEAEKVIAKAVQPKKKRREEKGDDENDPTYKILVAALFAKFKEHRGVDPEPTGADWAALKRIRKRTKQGDAEIVARWDRGLTSQFKQRVDSFSDLDQRWDSLAGNGVTGPQKDIRRGTFAAEDVDWSKEKIGEIKLVQ